MVHKIVSSACIYKCFAKVGFANQILLRPLFLLILTRPTDLMLTLDILMHCNIKYYIVIIIITGALIRFAILNIYRKIQ